MYRIQLSFLLCCAFISQFAYGLVVDGTFTANQTCPAYLFKNIKSNPGNIVTTPNTSYHLKEINREKPQWMLIEHPQTQGNRWVHAKCGTANYKLYAHKQKKRLPQCRTQGLGESHTLALSWVPGFCETYGFAAGLAECRALHSNNYASSHFSLHGLWPDLAQCGIHYGYCSGEFKTNHCAYQPIALPSNVDKKLKKMMPSYAYGSCLERHEWVKHGTCQNRTQEQYFDKSLQLVEEVNASLFLAYIKDNIGTSVERDKLKQTFIKSFGIHAKNKLFLGCKHGILVDVFIALPNDIGDDVSISTLMSKAESRYFHDNCPKQIIISDFCQDKVSVYDKDL